MLSNMRAERYRLGLTARQVGEKIGKSGKSVLLYERGEVDPPSSVLIKLAKLYGSSPEYLIHDSSPKKVLRP